VAGRSHWARSTGPAAAASSAPTVWPTSPGRSSPPAAKPAERRCSLDPSGIICLLCRQRRCHPQPHPAATRSGAHHTRSGGGPPPPPPHRGAAALAAGGPGAGHPDRPLLRQELPQK